MTPIPRTILLVVLLVIPIIPGCASNASNGYAFNSTFDESIKTIAVPIFENTTLQRGMEIQLAESINKQIRTRTPWALAQSDRADTTLLGVITAHNLAQLSQAPRTGLAQEQTIRITINFEWRDNRTGDILVARNNFAATSTFVPQRGVGERIEHAQREAIEELAKDLISQLRESW